MTSPNLSTAVRRVAYLGLGAMGQPMARHLLNAGHDVTVFNRTKARAEAFVDAHGGTLASTPAEAAEGAEVVFLCVGDDPDVEAVICGESGVLCRLSQGAVVVDHTTTSAALARHMAAVLSTRGAEFIDAPVSGGQAGAENGVLTVMCGGDEAAFNAIAPVVACYARACTRMGPSGAGQLTKMVNQICVAGLVQGLSEGLAFGMRAGLDMERVIDTIRHGAAQSWQMDNRARTMCDGAFDFGFAVDWMRKDLRILLDEARRNGAALPATALIDQFYAEVQRRGGGRLDTSSLITRLIDQEDAE